MVSVYRSSDDLMVPFSSNCNLPIGDSSSGFISNGCSWRFNSSERRLIFLYFLRMYQLDRCLGEGLCNWHSYKGIDPTCFYCKLDRRAIGCPNCRRANSILILAWNVRYGILLPKLHNKHICYSGFFESFLDIFFLVGFVVSRACDVFLAAICFWRFWWVGSERRELGMLFRSLSILNIFFQNGVNNLIYVVIS